MNCFHFLTSGKLLRTSKGGQESKALDDSIYIYQLTRPGKRFFYSSFDENNTLRVELVGNKMINNS